MTTRARPYNGRSKKRGFIGFAHVFTNLLVDLTYAWLDPRLSDP